MVDALGFLLFGAFVGALIMFNVRKSAEAESNLRAALPNAAIKNKPSTFNDSYVVYELEGRVVYEYCTVEKSVELQNNLREMGIQSDYGPAGHEAQFASVEELRTHLKIVDSSKKPTSDSRKKATSIRRAGIPVPEHINSPQLREMWAAGEKIPFPGGLEAEERSNEIFTQIMGHPPQKKSFSKMVEATTKKPSSKE